MQPIKVLFISELLFPSNVIAVVKPFLELQKLGKVKFTMRYSRTFRKRDIEYCDVVVLCRSINPRHLYALELVKKYKKKLVYDIDDNFFELSVKTAIGRHSRHPLHLYVLTEMLKNADTIRVYSHIMQEIAQKYNPNVFLCKSYFDLSLLEGMIPKKHSKVRIVYATSRGKNDTLARIYLNAVARILEEFGDQVEFYSFGQIPTELTSFKNAFKLNYESNYSKYIKIFYSYSFDIGLAPLLNDRFHNSKTNNKFREYGAMGVCGVYSDTPIYSDCVTNMENGILVENSIDDWYNAIRLLVVDKNLREKIKKNALNSVKEHYSMQNTVNDWEKIITNVQFNSTGFNNILKLNIAIVVDVSYQYVNPRTENLRVVLGFCGIKASCIDINSLKKTDVLGKDLVICFINDNEEIDFWIDKFIFYGIKNLVIDTMIPFEEPERYPKVTFTNSTKTSDCNVFQINHACDFNSIKLIECENAKFFFDSEINNSDYMSKYCDDIKKLDEYNDEFYSVTNVQILWARLLGRYGGSYEAKLITVLKNKIEAVFLKLFMRISKAINPIFNATSTFFRRCRFFIKYWGDYFKINILKKY